MTLRALALAALLASGLLVTPAAHARPTPAPAPITLPVSLPIDIDGPTVRVRAQRGMETLAREVARYAPEALASIRADLRGLPGPRHLELRLVLRSADIPGAAPAGLGAPHWAAGVAYPGHDVIVVATHRDGHPIDVRSTVAHEVAHLALDAALGDRAPRWLHEGFAYLHSSDFSMERTSTLTGIAWSGNALPLDELERSFPAREDQAHRAYAQSYDFVAYLAHRGRWADHHDDGDRWAFQQFLGAISAGSDADTAARQAFGVPLEELAREWYLDLRERYLLIPVGLFSALVWILAALLLILAYRRRRRLTRTRLAEWEREERAHAERFARLPITWTSDERGVPVPGSGPSGLS